MTAVFELDGQKFMALNGDPMFKFTEAISLFVDCETQQEVDELWEKLSEGGEQTAAAGSRTSTACRGRPFPKRWAGDKDPEKSKRVMMAMLQMGRIDIQGLQQAYDQA
jgi:3-demethylubiquinone-9 3-methyltransferase